MHYILHKQYDYFKHHLTYQISDSLYWFDSFEHNSFTELEIKFYNYVSVEHPTLVIHCVTNGLGVHFWLHYWYTLQIWFFLKSLYVLY